MLNLITLLLSMTVNNATIMKTTEANINIYPNPSNGSVTISSKLPCNGDFNIEICDINGKVIYKDAQSIVGIVNKIIDLGNYTDGIYIYKIEMNSTSFMGKIILVK